MSLLALLVSVPAPLVWLVTALHVLFCLALILVIQVQRGRSGDLASAFGGGPTQVNMAAMSSEDFLTRGTKIIAAAFMVTSLGLGLMTAGSQRSVVDVVPDDEAPAAATGETAAPTDESATTPADDATATPAETAPPATEPDAPVSSEPLPATEPAGATSP